MKTKGIRILDKEDNHVSVELKDILEEFDGSKLNWSILFFSGLGDLKKWNTTIPEFMKKSNESENGLYISWKDLNNLTVLFWEIIDIVIIGNEDIMGLRRYEDDETMYDSSDIVIVKFDSSYWEVFSKDPKLLQKLSMKFKKTLVLKSDFEKYD